MNEIYVHLVLALRPRLCLRSGGLLKPRPVHVGKRNKINILYTLMSRHHCANICCAPFAISSLLLHTQLD